MKYNILILLLFMMGFVACYEDKGNYNYEDINSFSIERFPQVDCALGDTIQFTPVFDFKTDSIETGLDYEWEFYGRILSRERNLFYIADSVVKNGIINYRVKDTKTGVTYFQKGTVNIVPEFAAQGWVVLSEKNNSSMISYFRNTTKTVDDKEKLYDCIPYVDIYKTLNREELGGKPMQVVEHFCGASWKGDQGRWWIVQQGGLGCVEFETTAFAKVTTLEEQFVNHRLPANFKPVSMASLAWVSLVVSEDGKVYSRIREDYYIYNSNRFIDVPLRCPDNKLLDGRRMIMAPEDPTGIVGILVYDQTNKRFVIIQDSDTDYSKQTAGQVIDIKVDEKEYAKVPGFARLDNMGDFKVLYTSFYGSSSVMKYYSILEKEGQYYSHRFGLKNGMDGRATVEGQDLLNFSQLQITDETIFDVHRKSNYIFISNGKELWCMHKTDGTMKKFFSSFSSKITVLSSESVSLNKLAVGLETGEFYVLDCSDTAIREYTDEEKVLYTTLGKVDLGKVISIRYKTLGGNNWATSW